MLPRKVLPFLVFSLPVLIVTFAVLMAGYLLAESVTDAIGAMVLRWTATIVLLLTAIDLVLLIVVLGIQAISAADDDSSQPPTSE